MSKRRQRITTLGALFMVIFTIGLGLIIFYSSLNNTSNNYYGPPLPDAKFETKMTFEIDGNIGQEWIEIDASWVGLVIEAEYSTVCNCSIDIVSPSGIPITTFDFSLTQEEIDNGNEVVSCGQYVALKPGVWPGNIYGIWNFNYNIDGGPATIIVKKVISFGNPD